MACVEAVRIAIIGTAGRRSDAQRLTAAHFTSMVTTARLIIQYVLHLSPSQVRLVSGGSSYADHVAVKLYLESAMSDGSDAESESYAGLQLHLPAPFHVTTTDTHCGCVASAHYSHPHFLDNDHSSWNTNPGRVLNGYHSQFNAVMSRGTVQSSTPSSPLPPSSSSCTSSTSASPPPPCPTLFSSFHDLHTALALGAEYNVVNETSGGDAFHARNRLVAQSEHLIAFTFGGSLASSSSSLSAMLSSPSNVPCAGGTADTWRKCRGNKMHVPLHSMHSPLLTRYFQLPSSSSVSAHSSSPSPSSSVHSLTVSSSSSPSSSSSSSSSSASSSTVPQSGAAVTHQRPGVRERHAILDTDDDGMQLPRKRLLTSWLQRGVVTDGRASPIVC
jgi:hypothetical protein